MYSISETSHTMASSWAWSRTYGSWHNNGEAQGGTRPPQFCFLRW